jgi:NHL repeat
MRWGYIQLMLFALALTGRAQDAVSTLAGQALVSGAANGVGTTALFSDPAAIVADTSGNVYVADSLNNAIRKIATNGVVTTVAGQLGVAGSSNGTGTNALFNDPYGLALDAGGNLYVSDTGNEVIRKITPGGVVTLFAGMVGQAGFTNGAAGAAWFSSPLGILLASNGVVLVADSGNHCVRAISNGVVSTFAGSPGDWGTNDSAPARFNGPVGLARDGQGNVYVSDSNNHTIRKITPAGVVSTWAGVPGADGCVDGKGVVARFCKPAELALDAQTNLYVADSFNHVIRKIARDGTVSTVSGGAGLYGAADGLNGQGRFFNPYGLAVDASGRLVVADAYNDLVRLVLVPFSVNLQPTNGGAVISWVGVVGKMYQVQARDLAAGAGWGSVGAAVTAKTQNLRVTDSGGAGQRLYRVMVAP